MTRHKKLRARILSMALSVAMVFTMLPVQAFASTEGVAPIELTSVQDSGTPKVCENHTSHDEGCGYIATKESKPCEHLQEGGYSCAPVWGSGSVSESEATPSEVEAEYLCNHDDECGYAEAIEGADCTHTCEKCADVAELPTPPTQDPAQSEEYKNLLALINALPTMADIEEQDPEASEFPAYLAQLRTDIAAARLAYDALTAEEKTVFDAATLAKLTELEDMLASVSAAMPMAISSGTVTMPWGQDFAVNQATKADTTQVYYGNNNWLVIGSGDTGVASESGTMTLLAMDNIGGNVKFDVTESYTNNYGTIVSTSTPQSNLKKEIEKLTTGNTSLFTAKELAAISKVTLTGGSTNTAQGGMFGDIVTDALLWPLDVAEADGLGGSDIRKGSFYWWLRSPGHRDYIAASVIDDGTVQPLGSDVNAYLGVRPAFKLNLNSVFFASAAVGGKSGTAGATLSAVEAPTAAQKLTLWDSAGQAVTIGSISQTGNSVSIPYSGATTGTGQNISAIIKDATGKIKYYGKIADTSSNASGTATVTIPSDFVAGWTLSVFSEQVNADKLTDYASTPDAVSVVEALTGTVGITGTLKLNQTLTATVSSDNNTGTLSYQWKRGETNIGSNSAQYTTVAADIGKTLTCVVTSSVQTGSISATTTAIAKADGPTAPAAPAIDYTNETVATLTTWEYKVGTGAWTACTATMAATTFGWDGTAKTVEFRIPATANHEASAAVSITIPARPTAPEASAFTITKPTAGGTDGKLSGITSDMEYHTNGGAYTDGTGAEMTGITDGTAYTVRNKATASAFASNTITVTVASKTSVTVTFADNTVDYNGTVQTHETATTATGGTMTYSYATTDSTLDGGKPKGAGTYTVTASYESATEVGTATATLTINKLPLTVKAEDKTMYFSHDLPLLTVKYTGFIAGEDENNALTITTAYTASTTANGKIVGAHDITINGNATAKNYTITTQNGTLTVLEKKTTSATDTMPTTPTTETVVIPAASVPTGTNLSNLQLSVSYTVTPEDTTALNNATAGETGFNNKQNLEMSLINTATNLPIQPGGKITIFLPYPSGTDKNDTFTLMHILTSGGKQKITPTKLDNGLQFEVTSLSPFAIGWTKYVAPSDGDGNGDGSSSSGSTAATYYTITATAGTGGTMSTGEKVQVREGDSAGFTITPDKGYQIADVLVNGKSIGAKNYYAFTNVWSDQTIHATFKKVGHQNPQTGVDFDDVSENDWFYDAVMTATANGWFMGTSETTFSPNSATTRGMIATILYRMEGSPSASGTAFGDVADGTWYADAIAWAQADSIVTGYDNGNYGPSDNITREQLVAILFRYAKHKGYDISKTAALDGFTDSETVSTYAKEAMSWAVGSGLISGRGNKTLAPSDTTTRAEVATLLVGFEELFTK